MPRSRRALVEISPRSHRARARLADTFAQAEARFNTLRVWGGGMFLPKAFYDECDARGLLVYHDMQYAQQGHAPKRTPIQDSELRHAIRRLSAHTSSAHAEDRRTKDSSNAGGQEARMRGEGHMRVTLGCSERRLF